MGQTTRSCISNNTNPTSVSVMTDVNKFACKVAQHAIEEFWGLSEDKLQTSLENSGRNQKLKTLQLHWGRSFFLLLLLLTMELSHVWLDSLHIIINHCYSSNVRCCFTVLTSMGNQGANITPPKGRACPGVNMALPLYTSTMGLADSLAGKSTGEIRNLLVCISLPNIPTLAEV